MNKDEAMSSVKQEAEPLSWMFWRKRRYIVVLLTFVGYMCNYSLRVNVSVAIVAMTESREVKYDNGGKDQESYFDWNSQERGLILSSFFWGYIFSQLAGGFLAKRFGSNLVFGLGIGLTAVLAVLTPWLGTTVTSMIVIRVAQGTVITMPVSAFLAESLGWESVFYVFGCLGVVWYIIWVLTVRSSPDKDRFISKEELEYIRSTASNVQKSEDSIPWRSLLTSKPVYAIVASHTADNWGFYTMITHMPTFLSDTLKYDLGSSGSLSAAPYLAMGILLSIAGYLADILKNKEIFTTAQVRKYFNLCAVITQIVSVILAGLLVHRVWSIVFIIIGVDAGGFTLSTYSINPLDIAPKYASVILGISNTFATLPGIISPALTGYLVQNQTVEEWRIVFYITGGIYLFGCIVYWFWSSGHVQTWAKVNEFEDDANVHNNNPNKQ